MGTNYYTDSRPTCDNPGHTQQLHIGKSSGGWKFGFHAIPDLGLVSWRAWSEYLAGRPIRDEYDRELTLDEFRDVVEKRYAPTSLASPLCRVERDRDGRDFHDPERFDFYEGEFS